MGVNSYANYLIYIKCTFSVTRKNIPSPRLKRCGLCSCPGVTRSVNPTDLLMDLKSAERNEM